MSDQSCAGLAASVRQRLLNLSRQRGEDFNLVLMEYAAERLLYRLTVAGFADRFVLKGALLFALWMGNLHRPTRDLDLLGYGESSPQALAELFRRVCEANAEPDGLTFDPASVRVREIREGQEYQGQRVQMIAALGNARIVLHVDIGFGDVLTPAAEEIVYPTLLGFPPPRLRACPKETVVAEKLQAMVMLGFVNSRMKDFYDVWTLSRYFGFDGRILARAIQLTFERRRTEVPRVAPVALTADFARQPDKIRQWSAFLARSRLDPGQVDFPRVVEDLYAFLVPPLLAVAGARDFDEQWLASGPWLASHSRL